MDEILETIYTEYRFTDGELLALSRDMAQAASRKKEYEDNLKSAQTSIKASIAAEDGKLNASAEKIRAGYEMRPLECRLEYDTASSKCNYINMDTGEIIRTRSFTRDEQLKLAALKKDNGEAEEVAGPEQRD